MVRQVKLRRVGGSLTATLPKAIVERLRLEAGDEMFVSETDRGILLSPFDPETEEAVAIAARAARKYRHALRELAR